MCRTQPLGEVWGCEDGDGRSVHPPSFAVQAAVSSPEKEVEAPVPCAVPILTPPGPDDGTP